ncbi:MAG: ABC transporter ATP-binding protein [Deltaproteobacteria bacterium]|nr:ABC transporter ATP-binding protein [Deltaproteobacteria bacterium]
MLTVRDLEAGYGAMQVLWRPSLKVVSGTVTLILGPNGVGKSTLLSAIFGSILPWGGSILYDENDITVMPTHKKVDLGLALVPEGRHLFPNMTVHENVVMGAYLKKAHGDKDANLQLVHSLFPILQLRGAQRAGSLSGGEQQMLTIARALMTKPKLIMFDEPSQGLAPLLVQEVLRAIQKMREEFGLTILLVEQNVEASLRVADYVYVMHEGAIRAEGDPRQICETQEIREAYLGM